MNTYFWINVLDDKKVHKLGPYINLSEALSIMMECMEELAPAMGITNIKKLSITEEGVDGTSWVHVLEIRDEKGIDL